MRGDAQERLCLDPRVRPRTSGPVWLGWSVGTVGSMRLGAVLRLIRGVASGLLGVGLLAYILFLLVSTVATFWRVLLGVTAWLIVMALVDRYAPGVRSWFGRRLALLALTLASIGVVAVLLAVSTLTALAIAYTVVSEPVETALSIIALGTILGAGYMLLRWRESARRARETEVRRLVREELARESEQQSGGDRIP